MNSEKGLKVILTASEMVPFAKTGGLADVVGSLPKALNKFGNIDICTIIPKYRFINDDEHNLVTIPETVGFGMGRRWYGLGLKLKEFPEGWKAYFIDNDEFYGRDGMYGYHDDGYRFAFLSRAVLEIAKRLNFKPDIIHCNDWHTGLIPVYLKTMYKYDPFFSDTATIFTIHNLGYQGIFPKEMLPTLDIGWEEFKMEKLEFWDTINFIKGGIAYSDIVNTVSKEYSKEIQTPEYGENLDGLLRYRSDSLYGIINGLDYDVWDPAEDSIIAKNYDVSNPEGKIENKLALQNELDLTQDSKIPLVGVVSRLSYQKGLDIIINAGHEIISSDAQIVVEGAGEEHLHYLFQKLANDYPDNVRTNLVFDEEMARRIYAGSDIFMMPSRYEPCGLSQLIAMRYGSIPIVHKTGGLADTVDEYNPGTSEGTGFCFENESPAGLALAFRKALKIYYDEDKWRKLVINAMNADFSWGKSAREYISLYRKAIEKRRI